MKDVIKLSIVLSLNLILLTLAALDVILGETFIVAHVVLFITYYSCLLIGD